MKQKTAGCLDGSGGRTESGNVHSPLKRGDAFEFGGGKEGLQGERVLLGKA